MTRVYGGDGILLQPAARKKIEEFERVGFDKLPICMAKTHLSLSHDPTLANAPTGFTVTVRDIRAYTGAGWLVALCGDMQTMPGYGRTPAAHQRRHRRRGEDRRPLLGVHRGVKHVSSGRALRRATASLYRIRPSHPADAW